MSRPITLVEVGPRDGLQNEKAIREPAVRAELTRRLEAAGARRIEAVSFVHPKYVPQMAGADEVMAALPHEAGRSRIGELGVREIALADTIGVADPWAVTRKVEAARKAAPDAVLRLHFHDTRNTGLANAYAGVEAGIDVLDASVGGIGGCPFAPGATGNVATEDLVYMLERAGFETGYDLDALIDTARWIGGLIGRPAPSALSRAGGWPRG